MENNLEQSAEDFLKLLDKMRQLGPQTAPPVEVNLAPSQVTLILFLASNPGSGVQALAEGINLSKPTVSIGVSQLADAGYIDRQPDPNDGRAVLLSLTEKGQDLYQRTIAFRCQKMKRLLSHLEPEERITLLSLLEKAINSVSNLE